MLVSMLTGDISGLERTIVLPDSNAAAVEASTGLQLVD